MSRFHHLEQEALNCRTRFEHTLESFRKRLTLSSLADEALAVIDPQAARLQPIYAAVRSKPLLAAGILTATAWLFSQVLRKQPIRRVNTRQSASLVRASPRPRSSQHQKRRLPHEDN
jgi:hypothetical protein